MEAIGNDMVLGERKNFAQQNNRSPVNTKYDNFLNVGSDHKQGDDSFGFKLLKVAPGAVDVPVAKPSSPLKKKGLRAELRS